MRPSDTGNARLDHSSGRPVPYRITGLLFCAVALLLGPALLWTPLPVTDAALLDDYVRVVGVTHVHTTHSDGTGTMADIRSAANVAGVDFVIVTDHNTLAGKRQEGYRNGPVLMIVGSEVSTHEGHLLALGTPELPYRFSGDGLDTLRDLHEEKGFAFVAHPESPRRELRWTGWELPGRWGLEILNGDSQWRAAPWWKILRTTLLYPLNPRQALLRLMDRPTTLDRWDSLLARRRVVGLAGTDAHGITRYDTSFAIAQNYVLLERPTSGHAPEDIEAILAAIEYGRVYVGLGELAPAHKFYFVAERGPERYTMGDSVAAGTPLRLRAGGALPARVNMRLYRDGVHVRSTDGPLDYSVTEPGAYRVEVYVKGWRMPWILTNPIYLEDDTRRALAMRASRLPARSLPTQVAVLDGFDSTMFETAADPSTRLYAASVDLDGGPDSSAAGRLAFQLGTPTAERPSPFAALINNEPRDLSDYQGLVFSVRSDDTYRFWVQVRDRSDQSPQHQAPWYASVKSTRTWRRVAIPFHQLRRASPTPDDSLDLSDIQALVFLVDRGAVPPGTRGTIWIDDLVVY